jgi:hypothetical protein
LPGCLSVHQFVCKYVPSSCPAHNSVIWSLILKLFHRNDHHIETTCHGQHLGGYLEGQGHSMTLQQNCVWPITSLFEVGFYTTISQKWSPYWDNVSLSTFLLFLHFEFCVWHYSDTTRGIPSCVQNLFRKHHTVQLALVLVIFGAAVEISLFLSWS